MKEETAKVEINETELEILKWYWENRERLKPGSFVIHFDDKGRIRKKEEHTYSS